MQELIVTQNITLDGVIDAAESWFDPSDGEGTDQSDLIEAVHEGMATTDALLFGRVTFEQMRGYWPLQTGDVTGVRDHLNEAHKYVVSRTLQDPAWERSTVLRGPLLEEVQRLKAQPGKGIVATGSMSLMPELVAGDVVDEYRLFVYPVVLGHRKRLFVEGSVPSAMRWVDTKTTSTGVVASIYQPTGKPQYGSFALEDS